MTPPRPLKSGAESQTPSPIRRPMTKPLASLAGTTGAVLFAAAILRAAGPTFWVVSTQVDFLKGNVEAISIDDMGRLGLGPETTVLADTAAPALWAAVPAAGGGYWLGSGNDGKVLRVASDGSVSTLFDAAEAEVHALAAAPDGGVYAATSPDGRIYKVAADGTSTVFFDPDDKYIWSLVVDASGTVYAGTGDAGVVYRIAPDGTARPFYDTRASHVVCLAFDGEGRLLAGTESPGRLFRIDASGKGFVLLDSPFKEVHAIRVDASGAIYVTAIDGKAPGESASSTPPAESPSPTTMPTPLVSSEITFAILDTGTAAGGSAVPAAAKTGTRGSPVGAVYRIAPDGIWDKVWESSTDTPFDVAVDQRGGVLVGTGDDGKIFQLAGTAPKVTLLTSVAAKQVTRLLPAADGSLLALGSNPGRLFRLSRQPARQGTYRSEVRDAGTVATWGVIRWHASGGGTVAIATRSGNTATPDDTWSDWSAPYGDAGGDPITSPKARYLQWRAVLGTGSGSAAAPALTSVTAAYLPRNQRPVVEAVTVHPPGTVFQRPFPTGDVVELAGFEATPVDGRPGVGLATAGSGQPQLGRRLYQKGLQTFAWTVTDADDDTLQYTVLYRQDGDADWKTLKRDLWEPILVWDTTSVPDGSYTIKVVATDAPTNTPDAALTGEGESASFDIDNTPPRIEMAAPRQDARGTVVTFVVRDDHSPIERVEYSVDAERWRVVYPEDGLPDSRVERFALVLDGEAAARSVIIRAADRMQNVATASGR